MLIWYFYAVNLLSMHPYFTMYFWTLPFLIFNLKTKNDVTLNWIICHLSTCFLRLQKSHKQFLKHVLKRIIFKVIHCTCMHALKLPVNVVACSKHKLRHMITYSHFESDTSACKNFTKFQVRNYKHNNPS